MSFTGFHEGRLPVPIGVGASSGPQWQTETLVFESGKEARNGRWSAPRQRWDLVTPPLQRPVFEQLQTFYNARMGRLYGFRYRDPFLNSSAPGRGGRSAIDQELGTGDGDRTSFQLRISSDGSGRRVLKPDPGSILLALDGELQTSGWAADETTGWIEFDVPPPLGAIVTAGFDYDWPVRFDTDRLDVTFDQIGAGRVVHLPLIELK
jgi:uncharacterized protein (TIGR02217 family)